MAFVDQIVLGWLNSWQIEYCVTPSFQSATQCEQKNFKLHSRDKKGNCHLLAGKFVPGLRKKVPKSSYGHARSVFFFFFVFFTKQKVHKQFSGIQMRHFKTLGIATGTTSASEGFSISPPPLVLFLIVLHSMRKIVEHPDQVPAAAHHSPTP